MPAGQEYTPTGSFRTDNDACNVVRVGDEIAAFDADIAELEAAMDAFLMTLPNFPHGERAAGQGRSRQRRKAPLGHAA